MSTYEAMLLSAGFAIAFGFLCIVLYRLLRPLFDVTVACWFCHQKSVVPYENRNCWDCLFCDQYNGFQDDGGYNKAIPAQHVEELNHPVTAGDRKDGYWKAENGLCETCNRNQQLKICQLANFMPYHEANFDAEVAAYAKELENVYLLCSRCTAYVDATLRQQDAILSPRLLDDRLRKTASEHSHSSSRSSSTSQQSGNRVQCSQQPPAVGLLALLASALDCLSATCAALTVACHSADVLLASTAPLGGMVPSWMHAAAAAAAAATTTTWLLAVPFTRGELVALFALTGLCAKATALVMRGLVRPLCINVVAGMAWCLLLVDSLCPPSWMVGDVELACRTLCPLAAVATTVLSLSRAGRRPPRTSAATADKRARLRRAGRPCSSLSGSDSRASVRPARHCDDDDCAGRSIVGSRRSLASMSGLRPAPPASLSPRQRPFDVQSSLGSLCLDAAADGSAVVRWRPSHPAAARTWSASSVFSGRTSGPMTNPLAKAAGPPLIRPGRLSPSPPPSPLEPAVHPTGSACGMTATAPAAGQCFQDLRHFSGLLPTERGVSPPSVGSVRSGRSRTPPPWLTRPYSEDGSVSCFNSSYRTAGVPRSVAGMLARQNAVSARGRQQAAGVTTGSRSLKRPHADKPLFAKLVIGISVGLNVTALALLAHQYVH